MSKNIVVGVDGSVSALHAVRWAANEAARRRLGLSIVHAHVVPPLDLPASYRTESMAWSRDYLRDAAEAAREVQPGVEIDVELTVQSAVDLLVEMSKNASLVVLGSRGLGGFTGMLVGSTAIGLASRAHCPIVVVRGATVDGPPPDSGPVVVGVDGSPTSEAAIAFAYEAASWRGAELVAVHTWSDVPLEWGGAMPLPEIDWFTREGEERRLLAERLAGWGEKYPDVVVHRVVHQDRPVRRLLQEAENAQLIVVGSRGRGGFTGMLLGSTSQALLHHTTCPIAVVRPELPRS